MSGLGKLLIVSGVVLVLAGVVVLAAGRVPWLGRLPGDIVVRRDNFTVYFPLASCLLVSALVSLLLFLFRR
jgi:hypothetical protein